MTAKNMNAVIGLEVLVRMETVEVSCRIEDAKMSYGKARLLIHPINGAGQMWIETARVIGFTDLQKVSKGLEASL